MAGRGQGPSSEHFQGHYNTSCSFIYNRCLWKLKREERINEELGVCWNNCTVLFFTQSALSSSRPWTQPYGRLQPLPNHWAWRYPGWDCATSTGSLRIPSYGWYTTTFYSKVLIEINGPNLFNIFISHLSPKLSQMAYNIKKNPTV